MKKLLVSMMLILGMLAFAAESAPSATVGYVKYDCVTTAGADLNVIAIPVDDPSISMAGDLDATGTKIATINQWNNVTQSWSGTTYNSMFGVWSANYAVSVGQPLQILVNVDNSVIINGPVVATPAYDIITTAGSDLNYIMHPLSKASLTMAGAGVAADIGVITTMNQWSVATQSWSGTTYNSMFGVWSADYASEIGKPLMALASAATTWPGAKGDFVDGDNGKVMPKGLPKTIEVGMMDGATGTWYQNFVTPPLDQVSCMAYMVSRPGEVLHTETGQITMQEMVPGLGSNFNFNLSAFTTDWATGDNLYIHVYDATTMMGAEMNINTLNTADVSTISVGMGDAVYTTPLTTNVDESSIDGNMPLETSLEQNYPNPFNPTTTINFSLRNEGVAKLNVYNYTGQLVNSLVDGQMNAGNHSVNFDASNLSAGVYYYTLEADNKTMTNKMVLVK